MAYTTINKHTDYFNTKLYTGTGSSNAITGVGFQPDWTWIKCRDDSHNHQVFDAVRGVHKRLRTDTNGAETESNESLKSFDSDGFTLGTQANVNNSSNTFAAWNWKANGQGSSNTAGSINTTYTSVNTTAGFSISKYTGTGANATVGHGLGAVPKMIIVKDLNNSNNWYVYHASIGNTHGLRLSTNDAQDDDNTLWNDTTPTSSVFSVGSNTGTNRSANPMIAYCFAEKTGYSKFGSYTGNGNADGTFVYTGFKPAFIMIKRTNDTRNWVMFDNKRDGFNSNQGQLKANTSDAEDAGSSYELLDIYSNGFKCTNTGADKNASGGTFIYMAFGQSLVGSNNVPCTAR